jgi:hypothetical protein
VEAKPKQPKKTEIHILDKTYEHIVEHGDGKEWGRRDCTHTEHNIRGIEIADKYPTMTVPFKVIHNTPYYLLYVLYQTGDSFGYDTGRIEFVDLYRKVEHATKNRDFILEHYKKHKDNYSDGFGNKFNLILYRTPSKSYEIYVPWMGYFERLESVEFQTVFLKLEGEHWS